MKKKGPQGAQIVQEYYTASVADRCPLCGSTRLVLDHSRGQLVCSQCGYVVDDVVFDAVMLGCGSRDTGAAVRRQIPSTAKRAEATWLAIRVSRVKLTKLLGTGAADIIESMQRDPMVAGEAIQLLRNPCLRRLLRRTESVLKPVLLKAIIAYKANGEYPLYAELGIEHNLGKEERRRLKRLLRRALDCLGGEEPKSMLAAAAPY